MGRLVSSSLFSIAALIVSACPQDSVGIDIISPVDAGTSPMTFAFDASRPLDPRTQPDGGAVESGAGGAGASGGVGAGRAGGSLPQPTAAGEAGRTNAGSAAVGGRAGAAAVSGSGAASMSPEDPACDLNGIWIARLTTFSRDSVFNSTQTASNWFYYEIAQSGRTVQVSKELDCGIQVSGSADVTLNSATTQALIHRNDETGRQGQFYRDGDHCVFSLERFYSTRGVERSVYLPADLSSHPELASIQPSLPTEQMPAGSEDWDNDGNPGIAYNVSGLGTRNVVQRDWNEYFTDPMATPIALSADQFVCRANFDNQEQILAVSGGLGALLRAGSSPAVDLPHRIAWQRLGRNANDAGVTKIRVSDDLQTCFNIQAALPHDRAMQ